jgi:hypothetical protein
MKLQIILISVTYGLLRGDQKAALLKKETSQSLPKSYYSTSGINEALIKAGYVKGTSFLQKDDVFKCSHVFTKKVFVCKIQKVFDPVAKPIEAQVFELIKNDNNPSLATMHELIYLGVIDRRRTYLEVLDYYKDTDGWSNLDDYIKINFNTTFLKQNVAIFKQIVEGVAHLYKLKISHSDIKSKLIML